MVYRFFMSVKVQIYDLLGLFFSSLLLDGRGCHTSEVRVDFFYSKDCILRMFPNEDLALLDSSQNSVLCTILIFL
jgi:hypothetical protein